MASAVQDPSVILNQMEELIQQAQKQGKEHAELLRRAQEKLYERNQTLKKIGILANESTAEELVAPVREEVSKPQPLRKSVQSLPVKEAEAEVEFEAKSRNKPVERKENVAPHERFYGNELPLKRTIWDILDRDPSTYSKILPDYPDTVDGLRISEIRAIIEHEDNWHSSSLNISPMIQQEINKLRNDGKVVRTDDRRYYIVEGAEYDGPKLDSHGRPIKN